MRKMTKTKIYWIDWLRYLAALVVVASHSGPSILPAWSSLASHDKTPWMAVLYGMFSFGQEGVLVFFALSGFLVGGKVWERAASRTFEVGQYALDRLTRIYVPYIPAVIVSVAVTVYLGRPAEVETAAMNLLQLQGIFAEKYPGNRVFWTLAYEFWFYAMAGALGAIVVCRGAGRVVAITITAISLAVYYWLSPVYLICWLSGAWAYSASTTLASPKWIPVGLLLMVASGALLSPFGISGDDTPAHQLLFVLLCLGVGVLAASFGKVKPPAGMEKIEEAGTIMADSSYSLYLVHGPIIALCRQFMPAGSSETIPSALTKILLIMSACQFAAVIFYWLFESRTGWIRGKARGLLGYQQGQGMAVK
jgi:peptidoglycan/LPS O-acetylase OafA/YrhL